MIHNVKITQKNKYTNLTSLVNDYFRVINEAVIVYSISYKRASKQAMKI
jgi:hypothetical protein